MFIFLVFKKKEQGQTDIQFLENLQRVHITSRLAAAKMVFVRNYADGLLLDSSKAGKTLWYSELEKGFTVNGVVTEIGMV